ncbi:MAG: hypothetical protein ISN28_01985 [Ectothiorhodospiraceae bacterium AqS1]|nr:hypothetical protein [Ectothiorhodospiraceae bacterium AqS1]
MKPIGRNRIVSLVFLALGAGLLALSLLDSGSGIYELSRRKVVIGDALAPVVACAFIIVGALLDAVKGGKDHGLDRTGLANLGWMLAAILAGLVLMRWAGPLTVDLATTLGFAGENASGSDGKQVIEYRTLRNTPPWKYIGFFLGSALIIGALIARSERRLRPRHLWLGAFAALCLIALYDLPFDDLLLPPNGDV